MKTISTIFLTLLLTACATVGNQTNNDIIGKIVGLQPYVGQESQPNLLGAGIGAGVGGVLGHQIGNGNGKTAATILGVGIGALAGSQIGKETYAVNMIEIWVNDNQGMTHKIQQPNTFGGWEINQSVRIQTINGKQQVIY